MLTFTRCDCLSVWLCLISLPLLVGSSSARSRLTLQALNKVVWLVLLSYVYLSLSVVSNQAWKKYVLFFGFFFLKTPNSTTFPSFCLLSTWRVLLAVIMCLSSLGPSVSLCQALPAFSGVCCLEKQLFLFWGRAARHIASVEMQALICLRRNKWGHGGAIAECIMAASSGYGFHLMGRGTGNNDLYFNANWIVHSLFLPCHFVSGAQSDMFWVLFFTFPTSLRSMLNWNMVSGPGFPSELNDWIVVW